MRDSFKGPFGGRVRQGCLSIFRCPSHSWQLLNKAALSFAASLASKGWRCGVLPWISKVDVDHTRLRLGAMIDFTFWGLKS